MSPTPSSQTWPTWTSYLGEALCNEDHKVKVATECTAVPVHVVLSIDTDKTSEEDLLNTVTKAKEHLEQLGLLVTEYTSYPHTCSITGHYVL
ncbi:hypothetical protein SAY86_030256 [Trapa natans]|uniref:Uncharacterized protein n=1 Tax=Trapa natans TaxID=22666 RepID=A0AAN7RDK4_TRANT|nr:hypothetical protein SAY86_030256 [Trapa natans]